MTRYLAVIEIDIWANDDLEAGALAWAQLKELEAPQIYIRPVNDSLEPWSGVDFGDTDEHGTPYVGEARPLCFDFSE